MKGTYSEEVGVLGVMDMVRWGESLVRNLSNTVLILQRLL